MKKQNKLNITFHNPNPIEDVVKELIKISAEIAKAKVSAEIMKLGTTEYIEQNEELLISYAAPSSSMEFT